MKSNFVFVIIALLITNVSNFMVCKAETTVPVLSVSGTGETKTKPDIATINVSAVTKGKTANEASSVNAAATQKLIDALIRAGIAENDIQTSSININPVYKSNPNGIDDELKILGYQAINQIETKIRKISDVGRIIDTIVITGNYTVSGVDFSLANSDTFEADALKSAVSDARRKANIVATAAGKTITGIKNISVGGNGGFSKFAGDFSPAGVSTPILPGELTVSSTVSIDYFLNE